MAIVSKQSKNAQLTILDFNGYLTWIQQAAFNFFHHSQPSERVKELVWTMREATARKSLSILLFEDYEARDDTNQLLNALQHKLESEPDYPLPAGYSKVKERTQVLDFTLSNFGFSFLGEAQIVAVEMMDQILCAALDTHFLEPAVSYRDSYRVREVLTKPKGFKPSAEALSYMKPVTKKAFEPKRALITNPSPYAKVALPTSLKLHVYEQGDSEKRKVMDEVAQTMELLLQALERGSDNIYKPSPTKKIANAAIKDKEAVQV